MGIDFKEDNTVNPPPQRMVHHTNHDKEFIKRKKRNVHFVLCLRNLIKLQGDVWHGYLCTQTVSTAEQLSALQEGAGPWALLLRTMAKLQSNGTPTSKPSPRALQPVPAGLGSTGCRRTLVHLAFRQSGLWHQTEASVTAALISSPSGS